MRKFKIYFSWHWDSERFYLKETGKKDDLVLMVEDEIDIWDALDEIQSITLVTDSETFVGTPGEFGRLHPNTLKWEEI